MTHADLGLSGQLGHMPPPPDPWARPRPVNGWLMDHVHLSAVLEQPTCEDGLCAWAGRSPYWVVFGVMMRLERRTQRVAVASGDDAFAFVRMVHAARMAAMGLI